ncbi:type VI secretion system Vgr family protein [Chitinimonas sp. PSY-7]|uniref:contractile injection system protein, VgrG/Pvc8 family n=1 Tax=Chitinimonas sp. PSY-7 TaxID=3459088 RepID=UPI00403FFD2C
MPPSPADLPKALVELFDPTALFDSYTRLFAIKVAGLPEDKLLVEALCGIEALSTISAMEVSCLSTDAYLDLGDLLGRQVALQISLSDGSRCTRTGYIAVASDDTGDGGLARYKLVVVPGLWYAHKNTRSRVFQKRSILDIVEAVLAPYTPYVVWQATSDAKTQELATVPLNYCVQYRESDYVFIRRLLADAGLGFLFEETGEAGTEMGTAAQHRLLIFADSKQLPEDSSAKHALGGRGIRFHGDSSVEEQDTIFEILQGYYGDGPQVLTAQAWHDTGRYSVTASAGGASGVEQFYPMSGAHATTQALLQARLDLIEDVVGCYKESIRAAGNVRSFRPGRRFTLTQYDNRLFGQPRDGDPQLLHCAQRFAGINNLPKAAKETIAARLGKDKEFATRFDYTLQRLGLLEETNNIVWRESPTDFSGFAEAAETRGYVHLSQLQRLELPWRPLFHAKRAVPGPLAAVVVGDGPIHTDRLGRVKVRFPWQLGESPDDTDTCWMRVIQRSAGPSRGMQFTPRPGHAVWVDFLNGDIDQPIVIGSQYNGVGEGDATYSPARTTRDSNSAFTSPDTKVFSQANDRNPSGQGNLQQGNSPVWHGAAAGDDGHRHAGALLGIRSQALDGNGYNQLLFDDSDGQLAVQLATTQACSQLNLGHLIHRADNYRGSFRGEGAELRTDAYGALRAGRGWLITSYSIRHDNNTHEPAGELAGPLALVKQAQQLSQALSQTTATHKGIAAASQHGTTKADFSSLDPKRSPLPAFLHAVQGQVDAEDVGKALSDATAKNIKAKPNSAKTPGTVPAITDPLILLAARGGIIAASEDAFFLSNETQSWLAGRHLHLMAGNQLRIDANQGVSFIGGLAEGDKDEQQGLSAIVGEGDLLAQAHDGAIRLAAKGKLTLESASGDTTLAAGKKIVIRTAGGASLTIADGAITVACPGTIKVQASKKSFVTAARMEAPLPKFPQSVCKECLLAALASGSPFVAPNGA